MLIKRTPQWWVAFLALNLMVPTGHALAAAQKKHVETLEAVEKKPEEKPVPQVVFTGPSVDQPDFYRSPEEIKDSIPDFKEPSHMDENARIQLSGTAYKGCEKYLQVKRAPTRERSENDKPFFAIAFIDKGGNLGKCLEEIELWCQDKSQPKTAWDFKRADCQKSNVLAKVKLTIPDEKEYELAYASGEGIVEPWSLKDDGKGIEIVGTSTEELWARELKECIRLEKDGTPTHGMEGVLRAEEIMALLTDAGTWKVPGNGDAKRKTEVAIRNARSAAQQKAIAQIREELTEAMANGDPDAVKGVIQKIDEFVADDQNKHSLALLEARKMYDEIGKAPVKEMVTAVLHGADPSTLPYGQAIAQANAWYNNKLLKVQRKLPNNPLMTTGNQNYLTWLESIAMGFDARRGASDAFFSHRLKPMQAQLDAEFARSCNSSFNQTRTSGVSGALAQATLERCRTLAQARTSLVDATAIRGEIVLKQREVALAEEQRRLDAAYDYLDRTTAQVHRMGGETSRDYRGYHPAGSREEQYNRGMNRFQSGISSLDGSAIGSGDVNARAERRAETLARSGSREVSSTRTAATPRTSVPHGTGFPDDPDTSFAAASSAQIGAGILPGASDGLIY